ncbi:hypothetical protein Tco_0707301 [Tanacetum coccineum]|uniref:Ribosomal protein L7Ae/L30e/S12e/Gadd45 n=1 Tax=Tanacetum coccineum TaxID=301880 RepID=A0ABQ4Y9V3_9ASTR
MESANTIKSSVEDLVPTTSESADLSDGESECDVPVGDESSLTFTTFSNLLFDSKDGFTSSDNESLSDEDVPKENFKIYPNPFFDDKEIISTKIDPHCFNVESYLIESLLNRDTLIDSSPKFDYLLEEFSGELAHADPIPPGVYDNSSPRPPKEHNSEIADTIVESLSPPPIPVEDIDSLMEEIDLFLASDDSMPPGIEIDDFDSERDIRFLEELLSSDSPPLPENESFSLDHFDDPSLPRPPPEPPDVEICFNFEPDAGVVTKKVVGDISEHDVLMPNLLPTQPTLCPVFDLLLPFSSENEDKVFKPESRIFISILPYQSSRLGIESEHKTRYEVQTDMSADMSVRGTRWQDTSVRETEGPYCTDLPTPNDIRRLLELERVVVDRTIKSQIVALNPNQILTKELSPDMKQWEELIRENVFGLEGHQDRLPACLAYMLYCVVAEEQYNLAYFFVKRIECAKATPTANFPYGMFLTRLYRYVMKTCPHLDNGTYDIVERVMRPFALRQTRQPRSDRGKARRSVSSSSSHHQGTSSHQHDDDDDDDVETSRASTPPLTTYHNSLHPLDYQNYQMPSSSEQTDETLFARQTTLLSQTQ